MRGHDLFGLLEQGLQTEFDELIRYCQNKG